jgi:hypothetical protein
MKWEPIILFMGPEESFSPKTERDHQTQILCYNFARNFCQKIKNNLQETATTTRKQQIYFVCFLFV